MVLGKLLGSNSEDLEKNEGIVWASFKRKFEKWHFGPNDEKNVVYDGIDKQALYRFVDDENETRRTTSYGKEISCNYEIELFTEELDDEWKEKRRDEKTMYLVAKGSWDGENLRYEAPVLVVEKPVFEKMKQETELAHQRSMIASPRGLHKEMRRR